MKSQTPQFINSALAIFGEKLIQVNDSNDFFGGYLEYDEIRSPSNVPKVLLIMHLNEGKLALNLGDDGKLRTEWVYRNNGLSNNLNESMILENIDFLMALKLLFSDRVVGLAVDMIKEFEALLCVKHNQQMIDFSKSHSKLVSESSVERLLNHIERGTACKNQSTIHFFTYNDDGIFPLDIHHRKSIKGKSHFTYNRAELTISQLKHLLVSHWISNELYNDAFSDK